MKSMITNNVAQRKQSTNKTLCIFHGVYYGKSPKTCSLLTSIQCLHIHTFPAPSKWYSGVLRTCGVIIHQETKIHRPGYAIVPHTTQRNEPFLTQPHGAPNYLVQQNDVTRWNILLDINMWWCNYSSRGKLLMLYVIIFISTSELDNSKRTAC